MSPARTMAIPSKSQIQSRQTTRPALRGGTRSLWQALGTLLAASFLVVLMVRPAWADDGALAEALFREAQALMDEGKIDQACPKFEESQRLDPSTGNLLNLAYCHERQGKLATAWNEYQAAMSAAEKDGREDRVAFAQERIAAIEPNLSRLSIVLPEEHDASGLVVLLDETEVGRPALGVSLPVDEGSHRLVVSAPGKQEWTTEVVIDKGPMTQEVTIPALQDLSPAAPQDSTGPDGVTDQPGKGSLQRGFAIGTAGLGLVGIGIGVGFGIDMLDKNARSNEEGRCDADDRCDAEGTNLRNEARLSGDVASVAFIAGGTLLATGVVLYLTAPKGKSKKDNERNVTATVTPLWGGAQIETGFTW